MMYISVCKSIYHDSGTRLIDVFFRSSCHEVHSAYLSIRPYLMSNNSVRSTNVYEEQSLGVFDENEDPEDEDDFQPTGPRVMVWSRYLAMHARKQLAFGSFPDMSVMYQH